MSGVVSAPGKLVVIGDFAVLDGAPARVIAMPQRARVRATYGPDPLCWLRCPPVQATWTACEVIASGGPRWYDDAAGRRLSWLGKLLNAYRGTVPLPRALEVDTEDFHRADGGKVGLGSSAAVVVALDHALQPAAHEHSATSVTLQRLIALHRRIQGGSGSGVDIAAALLGRTLSFRLVDGQASAESHPLPSDLHLCAVATPESVSTAATLQALCEWQRTAPEQWQALRAELGRIAEQAEQAAGAGAFCEALTDYGQALRRLESAAGLTIFGAAHNRLDRLAGVTGVAYKPSGAGGDCGIAAAEDPARLAAFRQQATDAGFLVLDVAPQAPSCCREGDDRIGQAPGAC